MNSIIDISEPATNHTEILYNSMLVTEHHKIWSPSRMQFIETHVGVVLNPELTRLENIFLNNEKISAITLALTDITWHTRCHAGAKVRCAHLSDFCKAHGIIDGIIYTINEVSTMAGATCFSLCEIGGGVPIFIASNFVAVKVSIDYTDIINPKSVYVDA